MNGLAVRHPVIGDKSTSTREQLGWKLRCSVYWSACPSCGREKWVPKAQFGKMCNPCSVKHKAQPRGANAKKPGNIERQRGSLNHMWKGGTTTAPKGYVLEKLQPEDPMFAMAQSGGYVMQHRVVVARAIGRPLLPNEQVHHRNGDKADNRIENLELWFSSHPAGQRASDVLCESCPYHAIEACSE